MVYDIFQKLYPKPNDFITPKRFYIREGDVIMFHPSKRKKVPRHFYLFNDRLLVTKRKQSTLAKYSDWLKIDVSLRVKEVDIESMKTVSNNNEFRLHLPGRLSYIFYAGSADEKDSWVNDIIKSINAEHAGDPKRKKQEEKPKEDEVNVEKREKPEKKKKEVVINDSEGSSDDEERRTPVSNSRSKMNNRIKSEVVSSTSRARKSAILPPTNFDSTPQETGNLLGFDPFAPSLHPASSPPTKTPVSKVKNTPKRTKISSSPVHVQVNKTPSANPFQPTLTPIPFNLNPGVPQYNPGFSPFTPQPNPYGNPVLSLPNPHSTPQPAPNPFTFSVQPPVQNPQPFYNPSVPQPQFTGQTTLPNSNPFMQMQPNNNTFMGVGGFQSINPPQGNLFYGELRSLVLLINLI